ncbi:hypothetical protein PG991_006736 [Apiospora marii]|uniref:Uncharacterized protein n=1 Tax=Apiospora marii TaxID=335849 RepID=A0ABR1RY69_9PEZI
MAMLGLGYPNSKYKECVEKLGVRGMMNQSREALRAEEWWKSDAIFFAEYRRLLGEDFEKCRKAMCPFAQPWTKEALQLKPYADTGLIVLDEEHDLDGHADDTAPSSAHYPGQPLEVDAVSKIPYPAMPRLAPDQYPLWLVQQLSKDDQCAVLP